jgi:hypothetical protein
MPYKDPEKSKLNNKKWYLNNREKKLEKNKNWRIAHPEAVRTYQKKWAIENRDKGCEKSKRWRARNPKKVIESTRARRAKRKNAAVSLSFGEKKQLSIMEIIRRDLEKETGRKYHIDHILPLAHGGIHHPINMRILEISENASKQDKILPEAIALAPEHFRLYSERVSPERAWEFVRQLAAGLGLSEKDLDALITGKPLKSKPTLEDFML